MKLRGAVVSGILVDSTSTGGLILKDMQIVEDGRGKYSLKDSYHYFKDVVFIRGDNVVAIMVDKVEEGRREGKDGGRR
ncbi:hypothetical protein B6U99_02500 [Candidatus Geothermarchaeota archaeon ex4572_27]|nr:MAG: hypothetical protein B6U99_02500 [Candidatus Geothermarchaeota archaeon ex4572_27]